MFSYCLTSPPVEFDRSLTLVKIFSGHLYQATLVKTLLESSGIHAYLENEYMGMIAPWRIEPGGYNPVKVAVSSRDEVLARQLVDEFNGNT